MAFVLTSMRPHDTMVNCFGPPSLQVHTKKRAPPPAADPRRPRVYTK